MKQFYRVLHLANGSHVQLRGRFPVPKSLRRDAATLALRGVGVGGGPKPGRASCNV